QNVSECFDTLQERGLSTNNVVHRAIVHSLNAAWPCALTFDELFATVLDRLNVLADPGPIAGPISRPIFAQSLWACYHANFVRPHLHIPKFAVETSAKPRTTAFNRHMAANDGIVVNAYHYPVSLDTIDRNLLALLDGTRDWAG